MPIKHLKDDDGDTMTVVDIEGYTLPNFPHLNVEENFRSIKDWKTRDDDIMLCTYPKSGTNWVWEILTMIVNKKAERVWDNKVSVMLEAVTEESYNAYPSPRVLNSHLFLQDLPSDLFARNCKIVHSVRNPKDVAVSFYNHSKSIKCYEYDGKWNGYFQWFIEGEVDFGSWFDYILHMEKFITENPDYPIHVLHFEDLKENGFYEIKRLSAFLGVDLSDDVIREIEKLCQFQAMKKDKDAATQKIPEVYKQIKASIYRKGAVSDWKNWFTVAQNDLFDSVYETKMKNSKTKVKFTLAQFVKLRRRKRCQCECSKNEQEPCNCVPVPC